MEPRGVCAVRRVASPAERDATDRNYEPVGLMQVRQAARQRSAGHWLEPSHEQHPRGFGAAARWAAEGRVPIGGIMGAGQLRWRAVVPGPCAVAATRYK